MFRVTKANGEKEEFDERKLLSTLERAGADDALAREVARKVEQKAYDGIPTKHIFSMAFRFLHEEEPHVAMKYDLKGAVRRLGPTGFPFELYVAKILEAHGYRASLNQVLKGKCVEHEVDVLAEKKGKRTMVECKFHNEYGITCHIQTGLYTYARFLDLCDGAKQGFCPKLDEAMLVTNTKFSDELIRYARCRGVKLAGWSYPKKDSLQQMIEAKKLYPITLLKGIDAYEKERMVEAGIIFARQVLKGEADQLKIHKKRLDMLKSEAMLLFHP